MHDNSDREDAERHEGEGDAVSEIFGEVFHRDVVRAEKRGRDEATDVPEEDVGGGVVVVGAHDDDDVLLLERTTTTGVHAPSFLLPLSLSLSLCFFFVKKKKRRKNNPIYLFSFFKVRVLFLDTTKTKQTSPPKDFVVWTRKDPPHPLTNKMGKASSSSSSRAKKTTFAESVRASPFRFASLISHDVSRVVLSSFCRDAF